MSTMTRKYSYDKDNEIFLSHYTDADGAAKTAFLFNPEDVAYTADDGDGVTVWLHCGTKVLLATEDSEGLEAWVRNWITPARMSTEWIEPGEEQLEEKPQDLDDVKLGPGGIAFRWTNSGFSGSFHYSEWYKDCSAWIEHYETLYYGDIVAPLIENLNELANQQPPSEIIDVDDEGLLRALLNAEDAKMSQREALAKVLQETK